METRACEECGSVYFPNSVSQKRCQRCRAKNNDRYVKEYKKKYKQSKKYRDKQKEALNARATARGVRKCKICSVVFRPRRVDQYCCSSVCREKLYRNSEKYKKYMNNYRSIYDKKPEVIERHNLAKKKYAKSPKYYSWWEEYKKSQKYKDDNKKHYENKKTKKSYLEKKKTYASEYKSRQYVRERNRERKRSEEQKEKDKQYRNRPEIRDRANERGKVKRKSSKYKEWVKKWQIKNRERINKYHRQRRAKKRALAWGIAMFCQTFFPEDFHGHGT